MAERRMFAKTIIDSDAFLDMPVTARLLYYDLAMRADDDGFVNSPKKIMRMIGASQDDLGILILRKFILPFEDGVVVIKHWRIHNYIRHDTYNETAYKEDKEQLELDENKAYRFKVDNPSTERPRLVDGASTQVRIGKDRLEERESKEKENELLTDFEEAWKAYPRKQGKDNAQRDYLKARKEGVSKEEILSGIEKYKWQIAACKTEPQYVLHGSTWFHQRRWTDEFTETKESYERDLRNYEEVYE